jgi:hypothetical protein
MLSGFTARQSTCRVVCRVSLRYHPSHATQGPSESLLPSPTQRFFARMTPDRPLIFTSRTSDPGQPPLNFLSFILILFLSFLRQAGNGRRRANTPRRSGWTAGAACAGCGRRWRRDWRSEPCRTWQQDFVVATGRPAYYRMRSGVVPGAPLVNLRLYGHGIHRIHGKILERVQEHLNSHSCASGDPLTR